MPGKKRLGRGTRNSGFWSKEIVHIHSEYLAPKRYESPIGASEGHRAHLVCHRAHLVHRPLRLAILVHDVCTMRFSVIKVRYCVAMPMSAWLGRGTAEGRVAEAARARGVRGTGERRQAGRARTGRGLEAGAWRRALSQRRQLHGGLHWKTSRGRAKRILYGRKKIYIGQDVIRLVRAKKTARCDAL